MPAGITRRHLAAALTAAARLPAAESRPNIVLMLSDDHTAFILGAYGDPVVRTPNLDRFARQGIRCDRAFQSAPQCVPSRAALMTGRSPVAARIARFNSPLPPDVITLPELLRAGGYYTGVCRRNFHLDGPAKPGPLMRSVFDRRAMVTWDKRVDYLDRGSPRNQTVARLDEFFSKAPRGKPFFLWVNFNDPHHVWDRDAVTPPIDPKQVPVPPFLPDLPGVREDLARYYNEVSRLDEECQWVFDALQQRGFASNTIVIFMGDNGMAFPHGKGSLYDPGLNVPLLIRWPGRIKPGSTTSELISGEDLAPTLLEAAGLPAPKEMSGRSFLKLLSGQPYQGRQHIFAQRGQHGSSTFNEKTRSSSFDLARCARSQRYKLIYNCTPYQVYSPVDSANDPGWQQMVAGHQAGTLAPQFERAYFTHPRPIFELYDLEKDPHELDNLAGRPEHAAAERELKEALYEKMILDYDFLPLPFQE
ncbi:MAG: sulfatase [Acidobacteria bacterium]|nr:sulfatase [Acidobacteriota bacterium]